MKNDFKRNFLANKPKIAFDGSWMNEEGENGASDEKEKFFVKIFMETQHSIKSL